MTIVAIASALGLWAQDFAPSQQAQGYLDSKNVTVDHATGLFHYKVPIYTLKSGEFELPITLDYVGKGVRSDDPSGLVGYNWTLNTGGIVTRTLRGGFADESYLAGYIRDDYDFPEGISDDPSSLQIELVNKRKKDGESDIFTAVFNGRSVNFIIIEDGYGFNAEPLEITNVKIEYNRSGNGSWVITDENGHKYYFEQVEWSDDAVKEDAISFNGVRELSYISSWYLTRIEPRNGSPITYTYKSHVTRTYSSGYTSMWHYGREMAIMKFKRADDELFRWYIEDAKSSLAYTQDAIARDAISVVNDMMRNAWNRSLLLDAGAYYDFIDMINHASFGWHEAIRFFGVLGDASNFVHNSNSSLALLSSLISACESFDHGAAYSFTQAKELLIYQLLHPVEYISTQELVNGSSVKVRSPLLDEIKCVDKTMKFEYDTSNKALLRSIKVNGANGGNILDVSLTNGSKLTEVSFTGVSPDNPEGKLFERLKFDYHSTSSNYIRDFWGFPREKDDESHGHYPAPYPHYWVEQEYHDEVDGVYCKARSLSKITTLGKGEILIDYESNVTGRPNQRSIEDAYYNNESLTADYGGVRIKSLVIMDPVSESIDSIKYHYPFPGELVHISVDNQEIISYNSPYPIAPGFLQDYAIHSRAKTIGNAFLNTGNNGVYYGYVEEEFVGKGKKTYLFFNPVRFQMWSPATEYMPYKFWLNGLPLGTATYDNSGNLISLTKNHYMADVDEWDLYGGYFDYDLISLGAYRRYLYGLDGNTWFSPSPDRTKYSKNMPQIKAYEYYIDAETISEYYRDQGDENGNVLLYADATHRITMNPHRDIYEANIEPRTNVKLPVQHWDLMYGGKVLLCSQEEYRINGNYSTSSSVNHFRSADLGDPYSKVEYFYDNPINSTAPTRITSTDSRGNEYTSVTRRVVDMNVPGVLADMKAQNILAPVVKQQHLINNKLLKETVNAYGSYVHEGKRYFGITQEKTYSQENNTVVGSFPATDGTLFTYGEQNYTTEKEMAYNFEKALLPVISMEKGDVTGICYNPTFNLPTLVVKGYGDDYFSATNSFVHKTDHDTYYTDQFFIENYEMFVNYYNGLLFFEQYPHSQQGVIDYKNSQEYRIIKLLVECVVKKFQNISYIRFMECCEVIRSLTSYHLWCDTLLSNITTDDAYLQPEYNDLIYRSEGLYYLLYTCTFEMKESEYLGLCSSSCVSKIGNPNMKLCILSKGNTPQEENINDPLKIVVNSSISTTRFVQKPLTLKPYWNIQTIDINLNELGILSPIDSTASINIDISYEWMPYVVYMCLVPADCEFESTSYNSDGTVFCKFDQTGIMERYEYDGAGRVTKVWDGNGKLLKENSYHINLP